MTTPHPPPAPSSGPQSRTALTPLSLNLEAMCVLRSPHPPPPQCGGSAAVASWFQQLQTHQMLPTPPGMTTPLASSVHPVHLGGNTPLRQQHDYGAAYPHENAHGYDRDGRKGSRRRGAKRAGYEEWRQQRPAPQRRARTSVSLRVDVRDDAAAPAPEGDEEGQCAGWEPSAWGAAAVDEELGRRLAEVSGEAARLVDAHAAYLAEAASRAAEHATAAWHKERARLQLEGGSEGAEGAAAREPS